MILCIKDKLVFLYDHLVLINKNTSVFIIVFKATSKCISHIFPHIVSKVNNNMRYDKHLDETKLRKNGLFFFYKQAEECMLFFFFLGFIS